MKIDLSSEATVAIKALRDRLVASQPYVDKHFSSIVSELVVHFAGIADAKSVEALCSRLITPSGRKRALIKSILSLGENLDDGTLKSLESSVRKIQSNTKLGAINNENT